MWDHATLPLTFFDISVLVSPQKSPFFERKSGCNFPPLATTSSFWLGVKRFVRKKGRGHDIQRGGSYPRNLLTLVQSGKFWALRLQLKGLHYVINRCPSSLPQSRRAEQQPIPDFWGCGKETTKLDGARSLFCRPTRTPNRSPK